MENNGMCFFIFFKALSAQYVSYCTSLYANHLFVAEFVNESTKKNISYQTNISPFNEHISLDYEKTKNLIRTIQEMFELNYFNSVITIYKQNIHGLKARSINYFYELIIKYISSKSIEKIYSFHSYDWFRILYVLRNITSHADNVGHRVQFPDKSRHYKGKIQPYPDIITWQLISITRGQQSNVFYSEVQIMQLMSHILLFFSSNPECD